jgi:hypothetical protein
VYPQRGRSLEETIGEDITRKKNTLLKKGKKHKKGWGDKTYTSRRTPSTFFFSLLSLPPNLHKGRAPSSSPFFFVWNPRRRASLTFLLTGRFIFSFFTTERVQQGRSLLEGLGGL